MDSLYSQLEYSLQPFRSAVIAFSGGVDSTLVLSMAQEVLAGPVKALTVVTPYMERKEIADAADLAQALGVEHALVEIAMPEGVQTNPGDRCYHCKRALFGALLETAAASGFSCVLEGSNLDDLKRYPVGLQALRELGIRSPLIEAHFTKADVRKLARARQLPTAEKPENACLLTRLPMGKRVSMSDLQRIEEAETLLRTRGYRQVRVRLHEGLARIEVALNQRDRLLGESESITETLESLGFRYITLDLKGYQAGSMNPDLG